MAIGSAAKQTPIAATGEALGDLAVMHHNVPGLPEGTTPQHEDSEYCLHNTFSIEI